MGILQKSDDFKISGQQTRESRVAQKIGYLMAFLGNIITVLAATTK